MKTVGIVIDTWKLATFKRHLTKAGLAFTTRPGLTKGTVLLKVECQFVADVQPVVEAATKDCEAQR